MIYKHQQSHSHHNPCRVLHVVSLLRELLNLLMHEMQGMKSLKRHCASCTLALKFFRASNFRSVSLGHKAQV